MPAVVVLLLTWTVGGAESTTRSAAGPQSPEHTRRLESQVERCDAMLARDPTDVDALQARAEALFRLGRIADSVRDFDRVVELVPASLPHNWQRGIALYYAGRLQDGVRQFERHQTVNTQDVENAAWHFLCLARSLGNEKGPPEARKQFITITEDPRVPLMQVHALYAGKASAKEVLDAAAVGNPPAHVLRTRLFYAHLYIALHHEALGQTEEARRNMTLAATTYGVDGYMGDVARVHAWWHAQSAASATKPAQ